MKNLIGMLMFLALLVAGPVWAQSGPQYWVPDPQGAVEDLDDPQPEECQFYMALPMQDATEAPEDRALCYEADEAQLAGPQPAGECSSPEAMRQNFDCFIAAAENAEVYQPGKEVQIESSAQMCAEFNQMWNAGAFYGRYEHITCRPE